MTLCTILYYTYLLVYIDVLGCRKSGEICLRTINNKCIDYDQLFNIPVFLNVHVHFSTTIVLIVLIIVPIVMNVSFVVIVHVVVRFFCKAEMFKVILSRHGRCDTASEMEFLSDIGVNFQTTCFHKCKGIMPFKPFTPK